MVEAFKDIYDILGIPEGLEQEDIEKRVDRILDEAYETKKSGNLSEEKYQMIKKSAEIAKDKKERKIYNNVGHSRYVEKENIDELEMGYLSNDVKKDFYDLFDLEPDSDRGEIRRKTAIKMKKMHPDKNNEESVDPNAFESVKTARNILTDDYERDKYDDMGHNRYVQKELDGELDGFTFSGRSSLLEGLDDTQDDPSVAEDVMEFKRKSVTHDPTTDALEHDVSKISDTETISEARRNRELVELRKEKMNETEEDFEMDEDQDIEDIGEAKEGYEKIISSLTEGITQLAGTRSFRLLGLFSVLFVATYYMFLAFGLLGGGISLFVLLSVALIKIKD